MARESSDERRMLVLRTVVTRYVKTREPVGSSAVSKELPVKASAATVRNDMAQLEDEGYLVQPHTSAGRIPTQSGYRLFVDRLVRLSPLSPAQKRGIADFLSQSTSLEETLRLAAQLLAKITGQVAVVASPSMVKARVRRFEVVQLSWKAYLVMVVTGSGQVEQRTVIASGAVDPGLLADAVEVINARSEGRSVPDLSRHVADLAWRPGRFQPLSSFLSRVADALSSIPGQVAPDHVYVSGTSRLARGASVSASELSDLFDALEEQMVVLRLLSFASAYAREGSGVGVAIGSETHTSGLLHAAVVSSRYGDIASSQDPHPEGAGVDRPSSGSSEGSGRTAASDADKAGGAVAYVGSIGPARMDYPVTMAAVKAVAQYLSSFLGRQGD